MSKIYFQIGYQKYVVDTHDKDGDMYVNIESKWWVHSWLSCYSFNFFSISEIHNEKLAGMTSKT